MKYSGLKPWLLPTGSIHVLVTTRRKDLKNYTQVSLDFFTIHEGTALLNFGTRKLNDDESAKLVEKLGGLPLALELCKNYLNEYPDTTIKEIINEIQNTGEIQTLSAFIDEYIDELPSGHTKEVAATFQMSWNKVSDTSKPLLQIISLLDPSPVPVRLLRKILKSDNQTCLNDPLKKAVREANILSLIELDQDNDPWMHRLIQGFIKTNVTKKDILYKDIIAAVHEEMKRVKDDQDTASYDDLEKVIPHAKQVLKYEIATPEQLIDISDRMGTHYQKHGLYVFAKDFIKQALNIAQTSYEPGHPEIAITQSNLALVLKDLGELKEAKTLLLQALESYQNSYEPGHSSIAITQSNLALVLKDLGELEEAKTLLQKALESDQKNYEPGHPSIAIRQSNLALVLKDLGELKEAKTLLLQALESYQNSYEPGHSSIATTQSNLALVLQDLGELKEAKTLLEQALESDKNSYEPGHPKIAIRQSNLANVLSDLGELEEAKTLLLQALESDKNSYEPGHPYIAITQSNLASVLQDLGELEEAKTLLLQALESAQKTYEPGHPSIAITQSNLAGVLQDLGEVKEAKILLLQALESAQNSYEPGHPKIALRQSRLNSVLKELGEIE